MSTLLHYLKGGGGGGGSFCFFFVKLDFEIAVDQQTKAHDQTFEKVLYQNRIKIGRVRSYEQNTIYPYLDIRNKYYIFWPINWANINIFE